MSYEKEDVGLFGFEVLAAVDYGLMVGHINQEL